MSKRFWIIPVALGLTISIVALFYSISLMSEYKQSHADQRQAAAQYQVDTSEHSPASCRPVMDESGLIDWLACLAHSVSIDGSAKQAEYELSAQQDMAKWALGMLIATIWLTAITLFGVYFVWRTLKATQDMARDTRDIGQKQVRANVAYSGFEVHDLSRELGSGAVGIVLLFKNFGSSPAKDLCFDVVEDAGITQSEIRFDNQYRDRPPPTFRDFDETKIKGRTRYFCGAGAIVRSHYLHFTKQQILNLRNQPERQFLYWVGWIRYKDDFWKDESDYRFCKFCFRVDKKLDDAKFIAATPSKKMFELREHGPDNYTE